MQFKDTTSYTYSHIKKKAEEYEQSQKLLLTERKSKGDRKSSFKLICAKPTSPSCPFRISFMLKDDGTYEFREKNSICKHNHGKFSKKAFQSQFFKRDFKHLEGPLKHVLESGFDKMQNIKPKVLLKIMKDEEMMTPNILKGFTLYHKSFKKKFDNLVRKVKESLKMDLNNSTANTLNSVSLEDFDPVFKGEVKEEQEEIFDESEEGKEQIKIELDFKEKKEERSSFEKFIDELENPKWIIPFTFY